MQTYSFGIFPVKNFKRYLLPIVGGGFLLCLISISTVFFCYAHVSKVTKDSIFSMRELDKLPRKKVGLVLGTIKFLPNNKVNLFYKNRIFAAYQLYQSEKVDFLLLSGDNSRKDYDEPSTMAKDLVEMGVPENRIYCDFAGFRTLDSIIRAKEVFNATELAIVSQEFHLERALYIAQQKCLDAVGFVANDPFAQPSSYTHLREYAARVAAFLDIHIIRRKPKFLGPKINISHLTPQSR